MGAVSSSLDDPADPMTLGGRYTVQMDRPLPNLDSSLAKAYAATDLRAASRGLFALVCPLNLLPRIDVIPQLSRFRRIPLLTPVDAGSLMLPDMSGRRFVIVFERPTGERVMDTADARIPPLRDDQVVRKIIKPLVPALKEMSNRFVAHRAIRADNLFYTDASRNAVVLGECVSAPAGLSQSALYEPIDAAMALPMGRGPGRVSDDLYAFGVMLVVLLTGGNPVSGMSDDELIEGKISHGSYSTLVGQLRVSLSMMEPLRGLLCDDESERWTVADIELWLGGRQLSPKQPMLPTRAARAISFAGADHWNRYSLSFALGRRWAEADSLITSGEIEGWVRRSYADDDTADAIKASGGGGENLEQTVARILMVLRPHLPIRYKTISARLDGLAQIFAAEFDDPTTRKTFIEMMRAKLPQTYLQAGGGSRAEQAAQMKIFDMMNYFLDRPYIGFGVERALYESNRGWPCQSPLIKQDYVCEVEDLLPALDRAAQRGASGEPVDAHIAAFCAARVRTLPDRALKLLKMRDDPALFRLGVMHMLAEAHRLSGPRLRFPALTQWLARLSGPMVETFHNRAYREKLSGEIERASRTGDLLELQFLVDNMDAQSQDTDGYNEARRDYANVVRGITWLEDGGLTSPSHVLVKGQQTATIISAVASGLLIVILTIIYVT